MYYKYQGTIPNTFPEGVSSFLAKNQRRFGGGVRDGDNSAE